MANAHLIILWWTVGGFSGTGICFDSPVLWWHVRYKGEKTWKSVEASDSRELICQLIGFSFCSISMFSPSFIGQKNVIISLHFGASKFSELAPPVHHITAGIITFVAGFISSTPTVCDTKLKWQRFIYIWLWISFNQIVTCFPVFLLLKTKCLTLPIEEPRYEDKNNVWYQVLIGAPCANVFPNIFCCWHLSFVLKFSYTYHITLCT